MIGPTAIAERERIRLLLQLDRYQLAEEAARRCLAANPTDWRAAVLLAHALRFLDRLEEAHLAASTAVGLAPEAPTTHAELAQVYGQQGKFEQAHQATLAALRLDPSRPDCHGYRAQLFYLRGSYNAAVGCAEEGLRINPRHTDCLLWRALAQEAKNQPEAADADFRRLLHLTPNSALLHNRLGQVLLRRYEPHQADIHLTTALRQQPEEAARLAPLIRQARRQATWPAWLLRSEQRGAKRRALGRAPGLGMLFNRIWGTGAVMRARWLTRHDPLFQPSRAQVWRRWLGLWLSLILIAPAIIFLGDYLQWFDADTPLTIPQMFGMLAGSGLFLYIAYLIKKQINT